MAAPAPIGRKDQLSNAFLDSELTQLGAMAQIIPPIFLLVSAFLINMILSRLIALEREQIGLLKALGYGRTVDRLRTISSWSRHRRRSASLIGARRRHLARPRHDRCSMRNSTASPS